MKAQNQLGMGVSRYDGGSKSDPARCVNTMCAGPRRTDKEFD